MSAGDKPFWETKKLAAMTRREWESLCDRCGQCCLAKIEDEETGEIFYTNVACKLFDSSSCTCSDYEARARRVDDCRVLTPENMDETGWLPESCAYRRLNEGKKLEWWHPLCSGDPGTVRMAGMTVTGRVVSEKHIHPDQLDEHVIDWINT